MIGKAMKNVRSAVTKAAKPAPRKPAPRKPAPVTPARGSVEQNYRGVPGLVNAAAPVPATPRAPISAATPMPDPTNRLQPPAGGGSNTFASSLLGAAKNMNAGTPAPGVMTGMGPAKARASFMKKGGKVKATKASAPKASSASKRGDGIATKGKTKGRFV